MRLGSLTSLRTKEPFVLQAVRSHWRVRFALMPAFSVFELPLCMPKLRSVLEYQPGTVAALAGPAKAATAATRDAARIVRFIGFKASCGGSGTRGRAPTLTLN
jgi:hypothetical protein